MTTRPDPLRGAWSQLGRVTIVPEGADTPAPWPGALVVATGIAIGAAAWLGARLVIALGAAPALAGLVAVAVAIVIGAAVVERGAQGAIERWLGGRWSTPILVGVVLTRVVALWSTEPHRWLGTLVLASALGRWAAVGLQRVGDVAPAGRGRSLVVGELGWIELAVASAVVIVLGLLVAGGAGLGVVVVAGLAALGLGLTIQVLDRELAGDSLAVAAAAIELVALIGLAAAAPAASSPFTI